MFYWLNGPGRFLTFLVLVCQLATADEGELSQPAESHVNCTDATLTEFHDDLQILLFRYLAGNPRWEIREERGLQYAVRLERMDGEFEPTLNGFYSEFQMDHFRQTRVLLSFGRPYGFGRERGIITRVKPGMEDTSVIIRSNSPGRPGHASYVIINGGTIFLEIYEQTPELERTFTQNVFDNVMSELRTVREHREEIKMTGVMSATEWYPKPVPKEYAFSIKDGSQPGIYLIDAAINPTKPGYVYLKAFDAKSGKRLSEDRMTERSIRYVGWSEDGKKFFHYGSEVTIYEGDWEHKYEARFELWHRAQDGTEAKLAGTKRMINGWQR